jgi:hypothetical protein
LTRRTFETFSRQFWKEARVEFDSRMAAADPLLKAVSVSLPETIQACLSDHLQSRSADLSGRIRSLIVAQDVVQDPQRRKKLERCSPAALERLITRCQERRAPAARRLLAVLQALVPLKLAHVRNLVRCQALARSDARLPVKILLSLMFDIVAAGMQPSSGAVETLESFPLAASPDSTGDPTMVYTHTVAA